jgi:nitrogen fixation NifU-like protein
MELDDLDDLYRDAVLDHCRHPRNHDPLQDPDITGQAVNPFCGDEIALQLVLDDGRVSRIGVQSVGCSINQASASMLSEAAAGRSIEEIESLSALFRSMMRGSTPFGEEIGRLGNLCALSGVQKFPVRVKCALLAWSALDEALER